MLGRRKYVIQNINQINIAKYSSFILGINFVLACFYNNLYFLVLGIETDMIELSLIDYIRPGLNILPAVLLFGMYAIFSVRPPKLEKKKESFSIVNKVIDFVGNFWILEITFLIIFILFKMGKIESMAIILSVMFFPLLIYFFHIKGLEKVLGTKISVFQKLLIKFVLFIVILFSAMGTYEGTTDKNIEGESKALYSINLKSRSQLTKNLQNNVTDGYLLKAYDNITIFKIDGKITIVSNSDILNLVKK